MITINGTVFTTDDISDIPEKYLTPKEKMNDAAQAMELPVSDGAKNPDMLPKEGLVRRGEKIKITSKGLCFSGPSAYLSNMAYISVTDGEESFVSNEQRYQWRKAIEHKDIELAKEIKGTRNSFEVKSAGGIITPSQEWEDKSPDFMDEMIVDKFEQNPELLERLIDTYPMELIEASSDVKWGGSTFPVLYI